MDARSVLSTLLFAAVTAAPLTGAAAEVAYSVKVLAGEGSSANGINKHGQVVGQFVSGGNEHAFLYSEGRLTDLGTLGGETSTAYGINDAGAVVGEAYDRDGNGRAFLYSNGTMSDLGTLGGNWSIARGINNAGVVVGEADVADEEHYAHAFRYQDGRMDDLRTLEGGLGSTAYAINNQGAVVGESYEGPFSVPEYPSYPASFSDGMVTKMAEFDGESYGINDRGQIVGGINDYPNPFPHGRIAFMYESGRFTYLGALNDISYESVAFGINNRGQVVGQSEAMVDEERWDYAGFLYANGTMRNLNDLIDRSTGWNIVEARGINDSQQIAATACKEDKCYAVRLDPIAGGSVLEEEELPPGQEGPLP